jgi:hypothetical protein
VPEPDSQSVLCKQVGCFVNMQEGKQRKGRRYQEVVSITQKAHKHSKTATNLSDFQDVLPRTVF